MKNEFDKMEMLDTLEELIASIPSPPPGREVALIKTKIQEAKMWLQASMDT